VQGSDLLSDEEKARYADAGVGAFVSVPIVKDRRLVALLTVQQAEVRVWAPEDVALLEETADRTWSAVERRRVEQQVRDLNATLEERVEDRTREVRNLAARLTVAEQDERQRIAHILHDDLQQQLYGLSMVFSTVRQAVAPSADERDVVQLDRAARILGEAFQTVRTLATELSPNVLQSDNFEDTLSWLAKTTAEKYGLAVSVESDGPLRIGDSSVRILLYQMLREVLFNVLKHAGVPEARIVAWEEDDCVWVRVEDDGAGFDVATEETTTGGFGLFSVRERLEFVGGRLRLESAKGAGTRVTLSVPSGPVASE